jgi:hypothetical protein
MQQNTVKIQTNTTNALSTNQRCNRYALDVTSNGKIQTFTSNVPTRKRCPCENWELRLHMHVVCGRRYESNMIYVKYLSLD